MPKGQETYNKWLDAAYYLFAEVGPDGLNIKSLSETAKLPRTNFYYHFADKNDLIEQLIKAHCDLSAIWRADLKQNFHKLFPDLYEIMAKYPLGVKFQRQLINNRHISQFDDIYTSLTTLSHDIIIPKVKSHFKLNMSEDAIIAMWETVIDTWYCRIDFDDFSAENLSKLALEIMQTIIPFAPQKPQ